MVSKLILSMGILLGISQAQAYLTAQVGNAPLTPYARTHILVAGSGNELGSLFQESVATKAKKYKELYPTEQIYIFVFEEKPDGDETNVQMLSRWGFSNIRSTGSSLGSSDFMNELAQFNQIASLDVYSHGTFYYGIQLDGWFNRLDVSDDATGGNKRLSPQDDRYSKVKGHFTGDAFVMLHGCNTGYLATILYQAWKVPVAGSFTQTNFEYLFSDGLFYMRDTDESGNKSYPKTGNFKSQNDQSFKKPISCDQGACVRLKPDIYGYYGYWGENSNGGLPFYKFFCSKTIGETTCQRGMAKAAVSFVTNVAVDETSSLESYKKAVQDILCPNEVKHPTLRGECVQALEQSLDGENLTYNPAQVAQIQCSFTSCDVEFTCEYIPVINLLERGKCEVNRLNSDEEVTTITTEYKAYINGYKLIHR